MDKGERPAERVSDQGFEKGEPEGPRGNSTKIGRAYSSDYRCEACETQIETLWVDLKRLPTTIECECGGRAHLLWAEVSQVQTLEEAVKAAEM